MSLVKYRLKEVATDFGVTPKDIAEVMGKFFEKPKSNTQVLTDDELNLVFAFHIPRLIYRRAYRQVPSKPLRCQ